MIIYEGPSRLGDGKIVAILTTNSTNKKTGPMAQLWILVAGSPPQVAAREGDDELVCGRCLHRPLRRGSCYVVLHQAPTTVYYRWREGGYQQATPEAVAAAARVSKLRLGAYGDPLALPLGVVEWLAAAFRRGGRARHTGYTHQWHTVPDDERARWQALCMASVDSPASALKAQSQGWRTFRVRNRAEPMMQGEVVCPAAAEAAVYDENFDAVQPTCSDCMMCSAGTCGTGNNVVIIVHGSPARIKGFIKT